MANKIESEAVKIDQALFKRLYDSATQRIPGILRREGISKKNPEYNKLLETRIRLFLSKNHLVRTILEEPRGDVKVLFDNIYEKLKVSHGIPGTGSGIPTKIQQENLFKTHKQS